MFTVEYVLSSDPLVGLIQDSPWDIFGRPYAAYLLFLFGEADAEASDWIRNNLRALDSVTGRDVAGVVFAKSVTIKARKKRGRGNANGPRGMTHDQQTIGLKDVITKGDWDAEPMFPDYLSDTWEDRGPGYNGNRNPNELVDIVATTYASDEVAQRFGVFEDVPCIVLVDAFASTGFEVIRLDDTDLSRLFKTLRTAIGKFTRLEGFAAKKDRLERLARALAEIAALNANALRLKATFDTELGRIDHASVAALATAQTWLREGSIRRFTNTLRSSPLLDPRDAENAISRAADAATTLSKLSKTIGSLTWYAAIRSWPLPGEDIGRLNAIMETHASALMSVAIAGRDDWSKADLCFELDRLVKVQGRMVEAVWGNLPDPAELARHQVDQATTLEARHAKAAQDNQAQMAALRATATGLAKDISASDVSIVQAYRDAKRHLFQKPATASPGVSAEAILAAALQNTTINVTMRDIYMAANVAAMGPNSRADNVSFHGDSEAPVSPRRGR
ncbi:hypothetical protein FHS26_001339 [Rhizobium pisi]|uniref:Uncharacterized protein n=1 Tax=Rhizobium pisi TaxID=574561 RepID=A0A3R9ARJ5_9HYPH|nr:MULTISPECIES: hypothetical protein [Rhizobium]MBB3133626.1 hypothetical protein [Rhizobium pisi]MBY5482100.1 hypothetical protein [Rhizobium leguminosarum]RSB81635.1 hypothetical protein EFD55_06650 [Rhizobium pisi]TBE31653.1 hypothetical protein ELH07_02560 [Rhizobium ruizarguesonis]